MRRRALFLPAALLAALASVAPVAPTVPACAAAGSNHAALVVEHGDGSVVTRCVAFAADAISGEELLNVSGVAWSSQTFGGFGDAVCALDTEPAHYVDCPGKDRYWAVFVARGGGAWQLASVGISTLMLHGGDAAGFRYVPASGVPDAPVSPVGVCAAAPAQTPRQSVAASAATANAATASTATAPPIALRTPVAANPTSAAAAATAALALSPVTDSIVAATAPPGPRVPAPSPSGDPDPGLLLAAGVGGGLAGLAVLRFLSGRRSRR
jgi:hypothetical protein